MLHININGAKIDVRVGDLLLDLPPLLFLSEDFFSFLVIVQHIGVFELLLKFEKFFCSVSLLFIIHSQCLFSLFLFLTLYFLYLRSQQYGGRFLFRLLVWWTLFTRWYPFWVSFRIVRNNIWASIFGANTWIIPRYTSIWCHTNNILILLLWLSSLIIFILRSTPNTVAWKMFVPFSRWQLTASRRNIFIDHWLFLLHIFLLFRG